jgi:DNA-binding transcriptional MerR regulator
MAYTVNKLAKLSGVSVRTLHFYDDIELLKPAYYGDNNYRYYQEAQLLMLQQILFYRELGFSLKDIQRIVLNPDFDKVTALESHRQTLERNLNQTKELIETIDKTIAHLRGTARMKDEELYYGFDSEKQRRYEQELVDSGKVTESEMKDYRKQYQNWTQEQKDQFIKEGG